MMEYLVESEGQITLMLPNKLMLFLLLENTSLKSPVDMETLLIISNLQQMLVTSTNLVLLEEVITSHNQADLVLL